MKYNSGVVLNIRKDLLIIGLLAIILGGPFTTDIVYADAPWKWKKSLRVLKNDNRPPMKMPSGVFVDAERERYYVADTGNNSLHSFDKEGQYLSTFSPGNQLSGPFDLARDDEGVFWTSEKLRNSLTKIDIKGKQISQNNLTFRGGDVFPERVVIRDKMFYVLDKLSGSVIVFDSEFNTKRAFGCPDCKSGFVDFDLNGNTLWALEMSDKEIYAFNLDTSLEGVFNIGKHVVSPNALAIGPSGAIYVLDRHAGDISVFDTTGGFKYEFLSKGHDRGQLYYPENLLFDLWGRLCVIDTGNGRVEIFSR